MLYLPLSIRFIRRHIAVRRGRVYTPMNENTKLGIVIPVRARVPVNAAFIGSIVTKAAFPRDCGGRSVCCTISGTPCRLECCAASGSPGHSGFIFNAYLNDCGLTGRKAYKGTRPYKFHLVRRYGNIQGVSKCEKILRVCVIDGQLNYLDEITPFKPFRGEICIANDESRGGPSCCQLVKLISGWPGGWGYHTWARYYPACNRSRSSNNAGCTSTK